MKKTLPNQQRNDATHVSVNLTHLALVEHGYFPLELASLADETPPSRVPSAELATVLSNMAYFGYAPSLTVLGLMRNCSKQQLALAWADLQPSFRDITGDNREMDRFVVYKNFPAEVLGLSEGEYWLNQFFMYLGAPNEWFSQPEAARPALEERLTLKVLDKLPRNGVSEAITEVLAQLVAVRARWTDKQCDYAVHLARLSSSFNIDLADFGFKENGVLLISKTLDIEGTVRMSEATDVLRLAAAMSGAEPSLREDFKFCSFSRAERRFLLGILELSKHLLADFSLRPAMWKRLLVALRPGDFKSICPQVIAAYDKLYRGEYDTFNSQVEAHLNQQDPAVLAKLASRPGEFARRLHKLYAVYGMAAAHQFAGIAGELSTGQLLKLRGYITTVNRRSHLLFPPKGNWGKLKVTENTKKPFSPKALTVLTGAIDAVLSERLAERFPQGVDLDVETVNVKLQTNDQELAPYGRGTVFPIPERMAYVRVASYWAHKGIGNTWFDNGVCFFDDQWQGKGTCCWSSVHGLGEAAVFSGDPTNSKDLKGRACQMIDLNLDKLSEMGVRFAVWNVLCYSRVPFSAAEDVWPLFSGESHPAKEGCMSRLVLRWCSL